jgi:hypothetical protein
VQQGHYALAADAKTAEPAPDLTIQRIGDLMNLTLSDFQEQP